MCTPTFSLQYTWTGTWYDIEKCKMCFYVQLPFMLRSRTGTLKNGMGYDTESNYWISCGIDTGVVDTGAATKTVLTASTEFRVCWKEKTMQCPQREVDYRNGYRGEDDELGTSMRGRTRRHQATTFHCRNAAVLWIDRKREPPDELLRRQVHNWTPSSVQLRIDSPEPKRARASSRRTRSDVQDAS